MPCKRGHIESIIFPIDQQTNNDRNPWPIAKFKSDGDIASFPPIGGSGGLVAKQGFPIYCQEAGVQIPNHQIKPPPKVNPFLLPLFAVPCFSIGHPRLNAPLDARPRARLSWPPAAPILSARPGQPPRPPNRNPAPRRGRGSAQGFSRASAKSYAQSHLPS